MAGDFGLKWVCVVGSYYLPICRIIRIHPLTKSIQYPGKATLGSQAPSPSKKMIRACSCVADHPPLTSTNCLGGAPCSSRRQRLHAHNTVMVSLPPFSTVIVPADLIMNV